MSVCVFFPSYLQFSHMIFHFDINCAFVMHDEIYVFLGIFCISSRFDTVNAIWVTAQIHISKFIRAFIKIWAFTYERIEPLVAHWIQNSYSIHLHAHAFTTMKMHSTYGFVFKPILCGFILVCLALFHPYYAYFLFVSFIFCLCSVLSSKQNHRLHSILYTYAYIHISASTLLGI